MRTCTCCLVEKPLALFAVSKRGPTKTQPHCKSCAAEKSAARRARNKHDAVYQSTVYAYNTKWRRSNMAATRSMSLAWNKAHPEYTSARWHARRAAKLQRTPAWGTELTALVAREAASLARVRGAATGFPWHVDHVIPLQGKLVSGLHVWNNLAVIPASVNTSKRNSFDPDNFQPPQKA